MLNSAVRSSISVDKRYRAAAANQLCSSARSASTATPTCISSRPCASTAAPSSASSRTWAARRPSRHPAPSSAWPVPSPATPSGPWSSRNSRVWLQSGRGRWNDVTDDQSVLLDNDPIDDQPEDFLLGLKRRVDERIPNAVTERLQPLQQPKLLLTPRALTSDRVEPGLSVAAVVLDLSPPLL